MSMSAVNLTVNPCKMCMPMGVVNAFYGIKKCMTILHGSQGCSTYIRRHMATHYNEPVDIASSSLTEQGTVFGGEENLIKGIENLIEQYNPEVIGVATTCLAETIGEDIERIIKNYYDGHKDCRIKIIPVQSAGYSGTQYEGFAKTLLAIVRNVEMNGFPNKRMNVVTGMLSPADTRQLKRTLAMFGIDAILLPDLSDNLDRGYLPKYNKLPENGTSINDIAQMAGATLTIELLSFPKDELSVGKYLFDTYGVPYIRMNMPVGLRDTDTFLKKLSEVSGREVPSEIMDERSRYLDAMIDSHKYNSEGRAAIFGEPDFVFSMVRLCTENGIVPLITATGTVCEELNRLLECDIGSLAKKQFIKNYEITDNVDFAYIENKIKEYGVNIMIGSSDGRRIEERLGVRLVRCAFPIHDRIGGQRTETFMYRGSLVLLDRLTNTLLAKKENEYREILYKKYYRADKEKNNSVSLYGRNYEEKTAEHPCFNCGNGNARIHLPIAPKCNISCNYCLRKFDCPNESRPGVTTKVLNPDEAFNRYKTIKEKLPNLTVVGIAGPGDALANFENTYETLKMIRDYDPEVTFCLSTNGLMLPAYVDQLVSLNVSHVTITINAVDPKIGAKIYKNIHYYGQKFEGEAGAAILLANQLTGLRLLHDRGIICKVNIVMLKGINENHIDDILTKVKSLGCYITNIMQMIPVQGSVFENLPTVSNKEIMDTRKKAEKIVKQMYHCKQCRADAVGTLDNDLIGIFDGCNSEKNLPAAQTAQTYSYQYRFAVASKSGILIDQHFGHATEFYIYEYQDGQAIYKEKREVPQYCNGIEDCGEQDRMAGVLETIRDCQGVLAMRIGDTPTKRLEENGIKVITTYNRIEEGIKEAVLLLGEGIKEPIGVI